MRSGFALPVTLVAMVVIGSLVAAILYVALIGRRSGGAMLELARVQLAVEGAAHRTAGRLSLEEAISLPVSDGGLQSTGDRLTRFGSTVWLVGATRTGEAFGARGSAGVLVVSRPPNILLGKGLTTPGPVSFEGAGSVDQYGETAGEGCGAQIDDEVGMAWDFGSDVYEPIEPWFARTTLSVPAGAIISPTPAVTGGVCDEAVLSNWGDPTDPVGLCGDFFPVVGVDGDLMVHGGRGQGVLIVSGDLTARAGFSFRGLVVVGGRLVLEGGARMLGAVQADDPLGEGSVLDGGHVIYSGCALREALSGFGSLSVLQERGWFRLY